MQRLRASCAVCNKAHREEVGETSRFSIYDKPEVNLYQVPLHDGLNAHPFARDRVPETEDKATGLRKRAAEMRAMAKLVREQAKRDEMLKVAAEWERLAALAERDVSGR